MDECVKMFYCWYKVSTRDRVSRIEHKAESSARSAKPTYRTILSLRNVDTVYLGIVVHKMLKSPRNFQRNVSKIGIIHGGACEIFEPETCQTFNMTYRFITWKLSWNWLEDREKPRN